MNIINPPVVYRIVYIIRYTHYSCKDFFYYMVSTVVIIILICNVRLHRGVTYTVHNIDDINLVTEFLFTYSFLRYIKKIHCEWNECKYFFFLFPFFFVHSLKVRWSITTQKNVLSNSIWKFMYTMSECYIHISL